MKNVIKYSIKLLFVIILPVAVCVTIVTLMIKSPKTDLIANDFPLFCITAGILLLLTIVNALFYPTVMSKTKLVPDIDIEFIPVIGFAIGYETNKIRPEILILLPCMAITIKVNKKFNK